MAATVTIKNMTCFKIGDDFSIEIWDDPWFKNLPNATHIRKGGIGGSLFNRVGELKDFEDN